MTTPARLLNQARLLLSGLSRSWFRLTPDERKVVIIILALFTLGLTVRLWHTLD